MITSPSPFCFSDLSYHLLLFSISIGTVNVQKKKATWVSVLSGMLNQVSVDLFIHIRTTVQCSPLEELCVHACTVCTTFCLESVARLGVFIFSTCVLQTCTVLGYTAVSSCVCKCGSADLHSLTQSQSLLFCCRYCVKCVTNTLERTSFKCAVHSLLSVG